MQGTRVNYDDGDRYCARCDIVYHKDDELPVDKRGAVICRFCHMKIRSKSKSTYAGHKVVMRIDC
jgi:hypothetical protein